MTDILTALLVLITAYYAWITNRILAANRDAVTAMREESEAMTRPYVQPRLSILPGTPVFVLEIKNTGRTTAKNLRLSLDKDFFQLGNRKKKLGDLNAFQDTIKSFPPDAELSFWLGTAPEMFGPQHDDELMPHVFSVTAEYEFGQRKVIETTTIDVRPFFSTEIPRDLVTHELREMKRAIDKVADALRHT